MRIAFIADAQSPNTASFVQSMAALGHEIHLLSLHHLPKGPEGVTTHFLSTKNLLPKALYMTRWPNVRRWMREIEPDLAVAYRVTGNGLLGALSGVRPLVVVPTGTDILGLEGRSNGLRRMVRYVLRRADGILCWAPHMARAVLASRGAAGIVLSSGSWTSDLKEIADEGSASNGNSGRQCLLLVQPRGVDRSRFGPRAVPIPSEERGVTLITTRSLKFQYGHEPLIRAIMLLQRHHPPIRLVLAGGGRDSARLWELASSLGVLDNVDFLGPVPHAEIPRLLSRGSIYASLIDHDGVSASMLEAMSVGLYPVVGDSDAARLWIRDGWNGSLVKGDDPEGVARAVGSLAADPDRRREAVRRNWSLIEERADLAFNSRRIGEWFGEVVESHRMSREGRKNIA